MILTAESKPFDRQFLEVVNAHVGRENVFTLGIGSYIGNVELRFFDENLNTPHVLVGRFCSLADRIYFSIGGNHNYRNVTTFPFDVDHIVKKVPPYAIAVGNPARVVKYR